VHHASALPERVTPEAGIRDQHRQRRVLTTLRRGWARAGLDGIQRSMSRAVRWIAVAANHGSVPVQDPAHCVDDGHHQDPRLADLTERRPLAAGFGACIAKEELAHRS
jgi:hypothetical protein